ncbi:MAG: hypothetical protein R6W06_03460 [Prochlorococcaceae cyanobacterium]
MVRTLRLAQSAGGSERSRSVISRFGLATVLLGFDLQGAITLIAGALLALITLYGLRPTSSTPDMTMSTSFGAQPSSSISKGCCDQSAYLSSLPRWRRWLSRFNWHPVVELEIREIERLEQANSRLERFEREHLSGSTAPRPAGT